MAATFPSLSDFLKQNKQQFLQDLEAKSADKWTVVMGNEAGDLDTLASSLAFSYLATNLQNTPTVALVQTRRTDLYLRPENLYALGLANLDPSNNDMLCIDDIPTPHPLNTSFSKYVLVDHNTLEDAFEGGSGKVVGVIDHHADDGNYHDAPLRVIEPAGSCTSLVTRCFQSEWTRELARVSKDVATLLLTGVTIDTGGLKDDDIVQDVDKTSTQFLYANSTIGGGDAVEGDNLKDLAKTLSGKKKDIGTLSTRDLLRRDYKDAENGGLLVGLSTVPMGLEAWAERDGKKKFWDEVEAYLAERKLAVLGILTTFKTEKKNKKKRELLFITDKDKISADVEQRLFDGLEKDDKLDLKETDKLGKPNHPKHTRVWEQGNTDANRKVIAPLVKSLIEG